MNETENVFLAHQPIVDRNGALRAFELLCRSGEQNFAHMVDDGKATARMIARVLDDIGAGVNDVGNTLDRRHNFAHRIAGFCCPLPRSEPF